MIYSMTWLPPVLTAAGLKVALVPGWESRGHSEMGKVLGVICHHTAGPLSGNMPSLGTLVNGRPDLAGPLAQLGLGRDGTFYVVAAGLCWHAGNGNWQGITMGNSNFVGIEAENTGLPNDAPWPDVQLDAFKRGVAAILSHAGRPALYCAGHKEYARPLGRKDDPDFDMQAFRDEVGQIMAGQGTTRPLIPAVEQAPQAEGAPRPTLHRGDHGDLVKRIQRACAIATDGEFDAETEAAVRTFQRRERLVPDGIVGPRTWAAIDAATAPVNAT